ncbi:MULTISPECIES: D-alanyl-D-alanine endopeptidase [Comamonas]|jgi:D-alanyl-D-alanine endopeptidase (penicillin-binding protein 7)|uniref:D-alanyl-D-alanine endopeptidase n=1 Tax=Comamonas aquatica TaxID=225991 RepID=A0AA42HQX9_9BURK|nr:D-alanyl-D-alanine endopeptidase [Comamonas aquatica]ANY62081.1 peptidase S11 [Comamonas aquatica]MDE1554773.1 D-alanyl-D-alanine endopeptidase [Comamonas aquatica]MDH0362890.1 D-alanyl-D-alanine endopeptidase [Comamonas aquatica]MDH0371210.1 D-alanyl-D-alanine endopeptidase [Comamonas aquatica]MDH0493213.1 D-alanyl-D-alanine endopeptidase [Comamonas aquatica]
MHHRSSVAYARIAKALAFLTLSCALATPAAYASKTAPAKKTATASKQQKAPVVRKAVAQKSPASSSRKVAVARPAKAQQTKVAAKPAARRTVAAAAAGAAAAAAVVARPSFGQLAGLHQVSDPLDLKSSVALVMDQETSEVLLRKNDHAVLPIASITKLMTGLLVAEAKLPMDEMITITQEDVDTEKNSSSRLRVGTTLTRGEMLHLALMSSENRAAHALGRTYPGGLQHFVQLMNMKAKLLGMSETQFVEPTGLSSRNQSSAHDLATLVNVAHSNALVREFSTSPSYEVAVGNRTLQFNNTNRLVKSDHWEIGLQKTGYISEAGRCLVMQAEVAGRKIIMVFLDSVGKYSRLGDAERVRSWVEAGGHSLLAASK